MNWQGGGQMRRRASTLSPELIGLRRGAGAKVATWIGIMETRARYILIGSFALACLLAGFGFAASARWFRPAAIL